MHSPQQDEQLLSCTESGSKPPPSTALAIKSESYLTVSFTTLLGSHVSFPYFFEQDFIDTLLSKGDLSAPNSIPQVLEPSEESAPVTCISNFPNSPSRPGVPLSERLYMSVYSTSSADTELSEFSNPPARRYRVSTTQKMPRKISTVCLCSQNMVKTFNADDDQPEKEQYIRALQSHQVNTLVELRRIEKAFAVLGTSDVSEPMTRACKYMPTKWLVAETNLWLGSYYVDSHGLLTELRGLTKNYPFR